MTSCRTLGIVLLTVLTACTNGNDGARAGFVPGTNPNAPGESPPPPYTSPAPASPAPSPTPAPTPGGITTPNPMPT